MNCPPLKKLEEILTLEEMKFFEKTLIKIKGGGEVFAVYIPAFLNQEQIDILEEKYKTYEIEKDLKEAKGKLRGNKLVSAIYGESSNATFGQTFLTK